MTERLTKLPILPMRQSDAHKGDFGRALLVGGSRGMSGAIAIAGRAAIRSGAGLVTVAVPDRIVETVAGFEPCYMVQPLPDDADGRIDRFAFDTIRNLATPATCVALGPGLGRSAGLNEVVDRLYRSVPQPMVIDADALNALSETDDLLTNAAGPRVLTPHPGEFARLVGDKLSRPDAIKRAEQLAAEHSVVIVLKGSETLVTDGSRSYFNTTGNPGMATGGSGDCLTGVIAALVCQQLDPFDAAVLGVYLHGRAGDLAAQYIGEVSLNANDIVLHLMGAFKERESMVRSE